MNQTPNKKESRAIETIQNNIAKVNSATQHTEAQLKALVATPYKTREHKLMIMALEVELGSHLLKLQQLNQDLANVGK